MNNEPVGIDIGYAHQRAIELIPEKFFWSSFDDFAPFGSDEGSDALADFRAWRKENPDQHTLEHLKGIIEDVGEMDLKEYNRQLVSKKKILSQLEDEDFDEMQYIWTLDVSLLAAGFGQLVDEGLIESANKEIIHIAIERQILWADLTESLSAPSEYIGNLKVLVRALARAGTL